MANTSKYLEAQANGDDEFFITPSGEDTSTLVSSGVSNIADYIGVHASTISSNSQLSQKNGVYIVTANCTITMPLGFSGLRIVISTTSTPTSVPVVPSGSDSFDGGSPTLSTSDIREYCFIDKWYRIR